VFRSPGPIALALRMPEAVPFLGGLTLLFLGVLLVFFNALFDALDGKIAKVTGKASARGDFLDHVLDRYADVFMLAGIILGPYSGNAVL